MVKYNYFENLEKLSSLSLSAVLLACKEGSRGDISEMRKTGDRLVCETEDALFSDFLPPLERDNIAASAHCLSRVIDKASELLSDTACSPSFIRSNEEGKICIQLAEELHASISILKQIRKPDELPNTQGFRELLREGSLAHKRMLQKLHSGSIPRSCAEAIILTGRLRSELSRAFDELVEIMLNNI